MGSTNSNGGVTSLSKAELIEAGLRQCGMIFGTLHGYHQSERTIMRSAIDSKPPESTLGWGRVANPFVQSVVSLAAVLAATAALDAVPLRDRPLTAALVYLMVVIASAVWGFRYAVFVSLLAALGFSWLLPPVHHFWLSDPRDVFALAAFLIIGLATSYLSTRARNEALKANQRRADAVAAQRRFADLVNSVEGIVWEATANPFAFTFVSQQAGRVLGYPAARWVNEPTFWKDHVHADDRAAVAQFCSGPLLRESSHDLEFRMIAADGRIVWLRDLITADVQKGSATRLRGVMTDITKRKQNEQTLREQADLLSLTHDAIFVCDMTGTIQYWNRAAQDMYGWTAEEVSGNTSHRVLKTVFPVPLEQIKDELMQTARWEGELVHRKKDGAPVIVASRWSLQRDAHGTPIAILEINNDITEQKRIEQARQELEQQWRAAFESNPTMYFIVDVAGTIVSVNSFGAEQLGYSVSELVGEPVLNVFYEPDRQAVQGHAKACFEQPGRTMRWEARKIRKDGAMLWVRETANAVFLTNRLVLLVICEDISQQKRAEGLLTGEKRILEMVAKGDSLVNLLDSLCRLVEEQASGVLASVLLLDDNCLRHGGAPSLPKAYTEAIDGVAIGPSVGSCGTAAYRGEQVIVEDIATDPLWADFREAALPHCLRACWSTPIFSSQNKVMATFAMYYREPRRPSARDQELIEQITHLAGVAIERKLTQEALRRSEAYLAEAQTLTHTGTWAYSPVKRRMLYWSDELFRLWGFNPQPGPPDPQAVLQRIHPEDRERLQELFERGFHGDVTDDVVVDHRIVQPDGTLKYHHAIGHPVFDEAGQVFEYVGTEIDVTEQKLAEAELERLHQLEADLAHVNRVSTMGELAASLAHEIKQPIAAAATNASACLRWLQRDPPDIREACETASRIVKDVNRAADIIDRNRSLYTRDISQREVVNLNDIVREMIALLRNAANQHSVSIHAELERTLPTASADRVQIQQVLMNLMLNGMEAMKDTGGELTITSKKTKDGQLLVCVSDSGIGLRAEDTERIFDAFFTTKAQGTGMGLSISRSIIESHGGRLWACANQGAGASFQFTLPPDPVSSSSYAA